MAAAPSREAAGGGEIDSTSSIVSALVNSPCRSEATLEATGSDAVASKSSFGSENMAFGSSLERLEAIGSDAVAAGGDDNALLLCSAPACGLRHRGPGGHSVRTPTPTAPHPLPMLPFAHILATVGATLNIPNTPEECGSHWLPHSRTLAECGSRSHIPRGICSHGGSHRCPTRAPVSAAAACERTKWGRTTSCTQQTRGRAARARSLSRSLARALSLSRSRSRSLACALPLPPAPDPLPVDTCGCAPLS
jgi:hypothetical protein